MNKNPFEFAQRLDNTAKFHPNMEILNKCANFIRQQQAEIKEWKRKYRDMHNLATQAMSRVHELEKAQKK